MDLPPLEAKKAVRLALDDQTERVLLIVTGQGKPLAEKRATEWASDMVEGTNKTGETCGLAGTCCWETFYIFAYCGLVGNFRLAANTCFFLLPFQRQPSSRDLFKVCKKAK